ncbi:MAG TPA: hypothetical protein VJR04_11900 [Terriglobales bacterium]|nr:hypothetical protein [Terriglobales bacterium]
MRVPTYILSTALLAGLAAAQTAPASQTVSSNPPHPAKPANTTAKTVVKSPFAPKTKVAAAPVHNTKKQTNPPAQAQNRNQQKAPQPKTTATKPKTASAVQAKAQPKTVKPAAPNTQQPKKEAAKKQEPKKPEAKAAVNKQEAKKSEAKAAAKKQEPKKPEAKPVPVQAKAEPKPAEPEKNAAPPVAQAEPAKLPSPGKRDPFLSPLVAAGARNPSNCSTGKRCLVVDQIVLKGVVQMRNGNLALVENAGKRPYVLHENDSLFNGSVVKITGDSLILREVSNDILGRPVTKEVVKKVTAPSV